MTVFTNRAVAVFAGYDEAGNPREIIPHQAQVWGTEVERVLAAFQAGGGVIFQSKAEADANLGYGPNTQAWVLGDPDPANNGIYQKQGASGSGSWIRLGDLPYSFIRATDTGEGTPDAIEAETVIPVPQTDGGALIILKVLSENGGSPVTVSFNGGDALTITTISGEDIEAGGIKAGMVIAGFKSGSTFQLITDIASAAVLAQMEGLLADFEEKYIGTYADDTEATAAAGGSPQEGQIYFNSTAKTFRYWDGDSWETFPNATVADGSITEQKIEPSFLATIARVGGFIGDSFEYGANVPEDQRDPPRGPLIRRQMVTTEDLAIFVDASAGGSGDGSQASPFQTINEALSLIPREIYHSVRVYLADGLYVGTDNSWSLYNHFVTPRSSAGLKIIGHTPENPLYGDTDPSAVVIGNASTTPTQDNVNSFVIGGILGDVDDTEFAGITFDGRVQLYTSFAFRECTFKTGLNPIDGGIDRRGIDGHSGRAKLHTCHFDNVPIPVSANDLAHFFLVNCTASGLSRPCIAANGSIVMFENCPDFQTAPSPPQYEGNSIIKFDGSYYTVQGNPTLGFRLVGPDYLPQLEVTSQKAIKGGGAFIGAQNFQGDPGTDRFVIHMGGNGNLLATINLGGTVKEIVIADFVNG